MGMEEEKTSKAKAKKGAPAKAAKTEAPAPSPETAPTEGVAEEVVAPEGEVAPIDVDASESPQGTVVSLSATLRPYGATEAPAIAPAKSFHVRVGEPAAIQALALAPVEARVVPGRSADAPFDGYRVGVHGKLGYVPVQAEPGSAGYDIHAPEDIHLPFNARRVVDTGIVVQSPEKLFVLVVPRSSTGTKRAKSVRMANTVGVIDPSYQGPGDTIKVCLERGDRRKDYVGRLTWTPSATNSSIISQAHKKFGVPMTPDQTELCLVGPDTYDVFSYDQDAGTLIFHKGDRFAQLLFIPFSRPDLVEVALADLDAPSRGGLGSTGR